MFKYILKSIREFTELQGKLKVAFLIFGIFIVTIIVTVEPFFMARVIAYVEEFYRTGYFPRDEFFQFLALWVLFILISLSAGYIHRYFIADKPALIFHNQIAYKYVENVYYMMMREYLSKKTGSIYKNFDRGTSAHSQILFFLLKDGIKTLLSLILVLTILIIFNWKMALLSLSMVPFMATMGWYIDRKTRGPQSENEERWTRAF